MKVPSGIVEYNNTTNPTCRIAIRSRSKSQLNLQLLFIDIFTMKKVLITSFIKHSYMVTSMLRLLMSDNQQLSKKSMAAFLYMYSVDLHACVCDQRAYMSTYHTELIQL